MNRKYKENYFSVIQTKTGKKICDCAEYEDALMIVSFDPSNRTITRNNFLMGQVVDIEVPKQLPTTEIVAVHDVSAEKFDQYFDNLLKPKKTKKLNQSNLKEFKGEQLCQ